MIVWQGWGCLTIVIGFGALLVAQLLADALFGKSFYPGNPWLRLVALIAGAVAVWFVGRWLNGRPGRVVIDKATGQEITLRARHTLFFIPMQYWAPIMVLIGLWLTFIPNPK
jgi:hypothetical protein